MVHRDISSGATVQRQLILRLIDTLILDYRSECQNRRGERIAQSHTYTHLSVSFRDSTDIRPIGLTHFATRQLSSDLVTNHQYAQPIVYSDRRGPSRDQ